MGEFIDVTIIFVGGICIGYVLGWRRSFNTFSRQMDELEKRTDNFIWAEDEERP